MISSCKNNNNIFTLKDKMKFLGSYALIILWAEECSEMILSVKDEERSLFAKLWLLIYIF